MEVDAVGTCLGRNDSDGRRNEVGDEELNQRWDDADGRAEDDVAVALIDQVV